MKRIFLAAVLMSCTLISVQAQERLTFGVAYQYALPMGGLKDVISDGSPRGFGVDILVALNEKWRIGGAAGFQDYYQKQERQTYLLSDGSHISAVVSHSLQTTPLLAKTMFSPAAKSESSLKPFISLGAGMNLIQYTQLLGEFTNAEDVHFKFAAQAGAGVLIDVGQQKRTSISLGALYNYMPFNEYEIKNTNNLTFQIGARFPLRNNSGNRNNDWEEGERRPRRYSY